MRFRLSLAFATLLSVAGCSASLYVPGDEDVSPAVSKEELVAGRALYVQKCGSCHRLRLPESHTRAEWELHLRTMAPRASLTETEEALVAKFLAAGVEHAPRK
jgi:hypothetical protein